MPLVIYHPPLLTSPSSKIENPKLKINNLVIHTFGSSSHTRVTSSKSCQKELTFRLAHFHNIFSMNSLLIYITILKVADADLGKDSDGDGDGDGEALV